MPNWTDVGVTAQGSVLSRYRGRRGLRRVKPISTNLVPEDIYTTDQSKPEASPRSINTGGVATPGRLLRVWLSSPWHHYTSVRAPSSSGESLLAYRKGAYFQKAAIRVFPGPGSVRILQQLSNVQHPNIAKINNVYCYEDKLFIATEYLELSLSELDYHTFELEEWEIATIIAELIKGSAYLLFKGLSCKELSMSNVRLSAYGDVKIVLDLEHYEQVAVENPKLAHSLLDLPFLAETVEEMMLSRYHLEGVGEAWSREALEFLSCSLSGSVESLVNHPFLAQAVPTIKLAPRIRFAIEVMRSKDTINGRSLRKGVR